MSGFRFNQFRSYLLIFLLLAGIESSALAAAFAPADPVALPAGAGPSSIVTASFRSTCSASNVAPGSTMTPLTDVAMGSPTGAADGDLDTYWYSYQTCGGSNVIAFTLDLGASKTIDSYILYPSQTSGYTISTSDDGLSWTPRHTGANPALPGLIGPIAVPVGGSYSARYLKYEGTNEAGWCAFVGIVEFQVFETCASSTAQNITFASSGTAQDVAFTNFDANNVSVLLSNGDGTFTEAAGSPIAVGIEPNAVISGDFDGDGNADLAVANSGDDTVSILFGNGDGTFTEATDATFPVGKTPYALTSGDLDGDGLVDIAVVNLKSGTVSILINKGARVFEVVGSFPTGKEPAAIVAADFNSDEAVVKDELAVANSKGQTVSILSLTKDPVTDEYTMTPPSNDTDYAVGLTPLALVTGDFNDDGMPDLAVANGNSKNISILLGTGTNLMATPVHYTVDEFPVSLTTADLNGDGKLDLATTHLSGNTVSVIYGNGNGKFQQPLSFSVGKDPIAVTAGNFDADGKVDLLTANYSADTLSLLINTPNEVINVTSPAGGEKIQTGTSPLITWDAFPGAVSYQLLYSSDNGLKFKRIAKVGNVTSFSWSVPMPKLPNMNDNLIKIVGYDANNKVVAEGRSKSTFAIEAVSLISPNGGDVVVSGATLSIGWGTYTTSKTPTSVRLSYWNGTTWVTIATLNPIPVPGLYDWVLPTVTETRHYYLVRIELRAGSKIIATDISDGFFTIQKAP